MKISAAKLAGSALEELVEWFECIFIRHVPGRIGMMIRRIYWSGRFRGAPSASIAEGCLVTSPRSITLGKGVTLARGCRLFAHNDGKIRMGDRSAVNSNVIVGASDGGEIEIGENVIIGPNVVLRASNHIFVKRDIPVRDQGHSGGKIEIGADVWIGANVVVLAGSRIGKGAVIGAGAVVKGNLPSYSLAGGIPAKVIKDDCRK